MDETIKPLWKHNEKKADREFRKEEARKRRANFVVEYDLAYDGGGSRWNGYYKTYWGARAAAFWNVRFASWGGDAEIYPYPKPVPPPTVGPNKKGVFRGRK